LDLTIFHRLDGPLIMKYGKKKQLTVLYRTNRSPYFHNPDS